MLVLKICGNSMTPTLQNGDHRSTSVDSRSKSIGCVAQEQVVGKILFRVWPLGEFGVID